MINWKVRMQSPSWWLGMAGIIASPVLAYLGLAYSDLTTWSSVGNVFVQFVGNPYLIGTVVVAVLGAIGVTADPTTKGFGDSARAMTYTKPGTSEITTKDTTIATNTAEGRE